MLALFGRGVCEVTDRWCHTFVTPRPPVGQYTGSYQTAVLIFHIVYIFHHNTGASGQNGGEGCCGTVSEGTLFTAAPGKGMTEQNSQA